MVTAHRINRGLTPELTRDPASDFHVVPCADPEDGAAKLLRLVTERIPAWFGLNPVRDVLVLCPLNRGGLGARALNLELQRALNPPGEERVERFGWAYAVGDKVMQVENDDEREVYNGDLRAEAWLVDGGLAANAAAGITFATRPRGTGCLPQVAW